MKLGEKPNSTYTESESERLTSNEEVEVNEEADEHPQEIKLQKTPSISHTNARTHTCMRCWLKFSGQFTLLAHFHSRE